jgi:hypothetical protein
LDIKKEPLQLANLTLSLPSTIGDDDDYKRISFPATKGRDFVDKDNRTSFPTTKGRDFVDKETPVGN